MAEENKPTAADTPVEVVVVSDVPEAEKPQTEVVVYKDSTPEPEKSIIVDESKKHKPTATEEEEIAESGSFNKHEFTTPPPPPPVKEEEKPTEVESKPEEKCDDTPAEHR